MLFGLSGAAFSLSAFLSKVLRYSRNFVRKLFDEVIVLVVIIIFLKSKEEHFNRINIALNRFALN